MPELDPLAKSRLPRSAEKLIQEVGSREERMVRRKREGPPNVWRSVGLIGLVGWWVALPMLVGVALGTWIDRHFAGTYSWTLMLLVAGLLFGCINAWSHIQREREGR
ncbi:MAG TPA: AtpZ/AtpI family protein [Bryobacteraceae bacterium]|nr:AtpZ/AtpI family protein [Bryobacteraceae bacterium]